MKAPFIVAARALAGLCFAVLIGACQSSTQGTPDANVFDGSALANDTGGGGNGGADAAGSPDMASAGAGGGGGAPCTPTAAGSGGVMPEGTGKADVSFTDRITQTADTNNFVADRVAATLLSVGAAPPSRLIYYIAAPLEGGGLRRMRVEIVDLTEGGVRPQVIYMLKRPEELATAMQAATVTYEEPGCAEVERWVSTGVRGSVVITTAADATGIGSFAGNVTMGPDQTSPSSKAEGTFTIRADLTVPMPTRIMQ